jgi:hypothetical protein
MPFVDRLLLDTSPDQITLIAIKQWLKIEHDLDNDILINLREVAVNEAYNFMQYGFEDETNGELVEKPIPFNIIMACLIFIAFLYEHRGDEGITMPVASMKMLYPYRRLVGT